MKTFQPGTQVGPLTWPAHSMLHGFSMVVSASLSVTWWRVVEGFGFRGLSLLNVSVIVLFVQLLRMHQTCRIGMFRGSHLSLSLSKTHLHSMAVSVSVSVLPVPGCSCRLTINVWVISAWPILQMSLLGMLAVPPLFNGRSATTMHSMLVSVMLLQTVGGKPAGRGRPRANLNACSFPLCCVGHQTYPGGMWPRPQLSNTCSTTPADSTLVSAMLLPTVCRAWQTEKANLSASSFRFVLCWPPQTYQGGTSPRPQIFIACSLKLMSTTKTSIPGGPRCPLETQLPTCLLPQGVQFQVTPTSMPVLWALCATTCPLPAASHLLLHPPPQAFSLSRPGLSWLQPSRLEIG